MYVLKKDRMSTYILTKIKKKNSITSNIRNPRWFHFDHSPCYPPTLLQRNHHLNFVIPFLVFFSILILPFSLKIYFLKKLNVNGLTHTACILASLFSIIFDHPCPSTMQAASILTTLSSRCETALKFIQVRVHKEWGSSICCFSHRNSTAVSILVHNS